MNYKFRVMLAVIEICLLRYFFVGTVQAQTSRPEVLTTAIDAKGVRHSPNGPSEESAPWLYGDVIKKLTPEYPSYALERRLQGVALIHVVLDLKTGSATNISVKKSSGFRQLDDTAVAALRHWRWKPEKWKEMDIPFRFSIVLGRPQHMDTEG